MAKKKVFQISNALTEGLEATITAAHNYSGELRIEVIPIKRIEVDPENPRDLILDMNDVSTSILESDKNYIRKSQELLSLQTMANSIREQGVINPIIVYKHGEKYRLVAGERRTLASIIAGKSEIQAKILDTKPSELKISLLQWIENVERTDLSLWERFKNLEKIVNTYASQKNISPEQVTITVLSNLVGCSKPHAMNYKWLLSADDQLRELIRENKIKNLEKAALISSIQSSIVKQQAINVCLAGTSLKRLKLLIKQETTNSVRKYNDITRIKPGRQTMTVNFGTTKNIKVAKIILDAVFKHNALSHFSTNFSNEQWNDFKSINEAFKTLLKKLEELYT